MRIPPGRRIETRQLDVKDNEPQVSKRDSVPSAPKEDIIVLPKMIETPREIELTSKTGEVDKVPTTFRGLQLERFERIKKEFLEHLNRNKNKNNKPEELMKEQMKYFDTKA